MLVRTALLVAALAALAAVPACPTICPAADGFDASLKAGDTALQAKNLAQALVEFEAAAAQAPGAEGKAFAIAKQAYTKSAREDWAAAKALATEALGIAEINAAGKVTALEVLARVQMRLDKDFAAAAKTLEEANALEGVDWAAPIIKLMLGDCLRETGQPDRAIAAYAEVEAMPQANKFVKATAAFCTGLAAQYGLQDADKARQSYARAVELNPGLKKEAEGQLSRLR